MYLYFIIKTLKIMKNYTLLTREELKSITSLNDMSIKITTKATFKRTEKKYPLKP